MNPQRFGSDVADIAIRIQINPEISIRIPDHFQLRSDALAEVCALWRQFSFMHQFLFGLSLLVVNMMSIVTIFHKSLTC